ncbi:MAG: pyruvate carboxylase subunit B [Oscillospiraceae bacterium]|jgi:oxaloacetate decarboxylase alpha subunit|nr:pyruvate carboxylase subunit B [Oscillospiraceae bacterium]
MVETMKVRFTETVLRDAGQSLIATRLPYSKFEGALETLDKAGYYSLECWGGATFDTCLRYLGEDPWQRLRDIRRRVKNTKLQMLLRGQNLLGYKHYPDDVVRKFVELSVKSGIDIIRIFDALNDLRNLEVSVKETIKHGGTAQVAISYTTSPVHTLENYVQLIKRIEEMGATELCIKDMAGIMSPKECYDLVKAIKENCKLPLQLHTHSTTGLAFMTYLKGIEAGADGIDTAISCMSGGTSQPATETLAFALNQLGYETGIDYPVLQNINDYFRPIQADYVKDGLLDPKVMMTDTDALNYQIPGGMLSNLISQLKAANAMDKLPQVLEETPRVRKDMGYPPLVTPTSQIVGVQAATNVLVGERYKNVSKEVTSYLRGEYGTPPGEVSQDLITKVLGDEKPYTGRFAETLAPGFEKGKQEIGAKARSDEDVLSYIVFPQVFEKFADEREERERNRVRYSIVKA